MVKAIDKVRVRRARRDEAPQIARFRSRVVHLPGDAREAERIEWLFGGNPVCSGDELPIWVAQENGQILGTDAAIPIRLKVGDGVELAAQWGVDLAVDERFRGRGIAAELNAALRTHCAVACAVGMSDAGYQHSLRNGYRDMGIIPTLVHVLEPKAVLPPDLRPALARPAVAHASALVGGMVRTVASTRRGDHSLCAVDHFDERSDVIWERVAPCYPVISRRDATMLRWRFDASPDRDRYQRFYLYDGAYPVGSIVLRPRRWRDTNAVTIVDYVVEPRRLPALLAITLREVRRAGYTAVLCTTQNPTGASAFRATGFIARRHADNGTRFTVRASEITSEARALLLDPAQWFLTAADADLDIAIDDDSHSLAAGQGGS